MAKKTVSTVLPSSILWSVLASVVLSLAALWLFTAYRIDPQLEELRVLVRGSATGTPATPEPSEPEIDIIPLESRPLQSAYPPAFSERRISPVLGVVRRTPVLAAGAMIPEERMLGEAVALTSDGWIVTTEDVTGDFRLSDLGAVWDGEVTEITQGYHDRSTGFTYLKTAATGLPVTSFVRAQDVVPGSAVWVEDSAASLRPESVIRLRADEAQAVHSSETAARRFLVSGQSIEGAEGAAVWDGAGRLVGLLESYSDEERGWHVIPAGMIGRDLANLLSSNEIRRAVLGVNTIDLARARFEERPEHIPQRGAWVRPDRVRGLPAVSPSGPADDLLFDGDVIERIERDILDGTSDLGERLLEYRPGASVTISGRRNDGAFSVEVTLGSEPVTEALR